MRNIRFRGKQIDGAKWIEGYYVRCRGHHYILPVYDTDHGFDERYTDWMEVDVITVCQYTSLLDHYAKKIFEGDIISFEDTGEEGYEYKEGFDFTNRAVVVWNNGRFELGKFLSDNSEVVELMNNCHEDFWNALKDCRVIGNIYDNPDLLNPQN